MPASRKKPTARVLKLPAAPTPAMARRGAATVHDVARLAAVSSITVSRALNTPDRVSEATLKRVREAIAQVGYVPNLLAGSLRSAKSRLVAAVVPTVGGPVFHEMVQALTDALDEQGYQLLLGQSGYKTSREDALIDAIVGRRPVGIVLTGMLHSQEGRRRLMASGIPVVETWDLTPTPVDMAVGFSHDLIGEAVCDFLAKRGRTRLVVISGDDDRARRRAQGFQRAAARAGLAAPAVRWVGVPTTLQGGREGLADLLGRDPRPDAVFCSSDLLALGVLTEAHARGIAVPHDLAVVGFGNLPFAAGLVPALTTVHVDGNRIGRTAAGFIIDRAEGRATPERIVDVGFTVIARDSA